MALADGSTHEEAAYRLHIGRSTLETHLGLAFRRVNGSGIVDTYRRLGWLQVPE